MTEIKVQLARRKAEALGEQSRQTTLRGAAKPEAATKLRK